LLNLDACSKALWAILFGGHLHAILFANFPTLSHVNLLSSRKRAAIGCGRQLFYEAFPVTCFAEQHSIVVSALIFSARDFAADDATVAEWALVHG
jgi:hypothetical protein